MVIYINKELALIGLLNQILIKKLKDNSRSNMDIYHGFSIDLIENTLITTKTITNYINWLHYSNCGLIFKKFTNNQMIDLLDNNNDILKRVSNGYIIKFSDNIRYTLNPNGSNFIDVLVNKLEPEMNYNRRFLKFVLNNRFTSI